MAWTRYLRPEIDKNDIRLVKRLLGENAVKEWPSFLGSFLLLSLVSVATAATAYLMKDVVNSVFVAKDPSAIVGVALLVSGAFAVKGFATYANALLVARLSMRIIAGLQRRFFASLLQQGLDFYHGKRGGVIMNRFSHNSAAARHVIEMVSMTLWRDLLSLIALVGVMVMQSPLMSLSTLIIGVPAVLGTMHLMRKVKEFAKSETEAVGRANAVLKDSVDNIKSVKAYRLEETRNDEMAVAIATMQERLFVIARFAALTVPMMEVLAGLSIGAAIIYAGFQVAEGTADPGAFFSFLAAFLMAYDPARRLARFNVEFQRRLIGLEHFYEMIDHPGSDMDVPDAAALVVSRGDIRFENVRLRYGKTPALRDVSFTIDGGTVTALVGPSGAGKTTVFSLIERFYLPTEGTVCIDGQDVRQVTAESLRNNIALVTQDPQLFEGTIGENIRAGRANATDEEVVAAAKAANAHDFIEEIGGYERDVGMGGTGLSGGQRQRISIARAILRDAPILLLDEATSSLDTLSEVAVQEALARLMKGRTTVAIAHRLSTIFDADNIIVLDQGRIVDSGRHVDLVARGGLYAQLYEQQVQRMQQVA